MSEFQDLSVQIEQISQAEEAQQPHILNRFIEQGLDASSIALILEAFPIEQRVRLWRELPLESHIEVLTESRGEVRVSILDALSETELRLTLAKLDNLSLIEWADSLPDDIIEEAISLLEPGELELYDQANEYEEEELGRWAERKVIAIPFNISVERARVLVAKYNVESASHIYLIDKQQRFRGMVDYIDLLSADPKARIKQLVLEHVNTLSANMALTEAVDAMERSAFAALPVLDERKRLVGEIDWKFALSTQREIYETRLMAGTGMDEGDDLFAPILKSSQKRGVWLGINLLTAILASVTIGLFEDVIAQVVALAVLMPIVASMGGIAGSQTLTLMVRSMALNQITSGNRFALIKNELGIGAINGLLWAAIIGAVAGLWFQSPLLGGTIALAIIVNIITAALFGYLSH